VFVLSSSSEGLSNTILEAMATGLPVVATAVGGADELIDDRRTGLLVPARDPEALAAALARVIGDAAAREAMGRAARARAESAFDLVHTIKRYEDLYEEVLSTRRRPLAGERASHQRLA
jgi:glycosyltransferase involved in cell wall biosynthesis